MHQTMFKNQMLFFIIFNLIRHILGAHFLNISQPEYSLFFRTNEDIQKTVNKLFSSLKLTSTFRESLKNKLLVNIHSNFRNITEIAANNLKEIKNISRANSNSETVKSAIDFNAIFDEAIEEIKQERIVTTTDKSAVNDKFHLKDLNVTADSSLEFMKDFWETINALKIDDIIKSKDGVKQQYMRRNLKLWDHTNITDYRRVYNGRNTQISTYPFLVSIHIDQEFVCSGSIIGKELIITAASCLHSKNPLIQRASIRIGSSYSTYSGTLIPIIDVFFHPSYDPTTLTNNLAIVRIANSDTLTVKTKIRRIACDNKNRDISADTDLIILGFGARDVKKNKANAEKTLGMAISNLKVVKWEQCRDIYSTDFVTNTNFCAGSKWTRERSGACRKDEGAPGVLGGILIGIVSYVPPICGDPGTPTVFTKVAPYANWINLIINVTKLNQEDVIQNFKSMTHNDMLQSTRALNNEYNKAPAKLAFAENSKENLAKEIISASMDNIKEMTRYRIQKNTQDSTSYETEGKNEKSVDVSVDSSSGDQLINKSTDLATLKVIPIKTMLMNR